MNTYSIIEIDPSWVLEPEQMGSKEKFWFRDPNDPEERDWLFKYPTPDTGQHWAEKIAYELACQMRIIAPRVELAKFQGKRGSATLSFTKVRVETGFDRYELFHGNQILAGMDSTYNPQLRGRHPLHTIGRIFRSMEIFRSIAYANSCRLKLAEYFVFDAVIGNVDRHHENWGILRKPLKDGSYRGRLAPSFDHASSLGRELQDEGGKQSRHRYLNELGVAKYVSRGRGAIYVDEHDHKGLSLPDLIRYCLKHEPFQNFFQNALAKIELLNEEPIRTIISSIPSDWMSDLSRRFVIALILFNLDHLRTFTYENE